MTRFFNHQQGGPIPGSNKKHSLLEEVFETVLFNCRFLVLLAALGSLLAAIMIFLKGAIELVQAANAFIPSMSHFQGTHSDDKQVLLSIMPAIDYFLFATVLLIFSFGKMVRRVAALPVPTG